MDRLKEFALDVLDLIIAIVLVGVLSLLLLGAVLGAVKDGVIGIIILVIAVILGIPWAMGFVDDRYYKWKRKRKKADK